MWNGPNDVCAAGSFAASARLCPTETVSCPSSLLTSTTQLALPRQTRVVLLSAALLPSMGQQFAAIVELWALTTIGCGAACTPKVAMTRVVTQPRGRPRREL